jgi:hypothetical protein
MYIRSIALAERRVCQALQELKDANYGRVSVDSFYCLVSSGCLASSKNWFCSLRLSSSALMALMASAI